MSLGETPPARSQNNLSMWALPENKQLAWVFLATAIIAAAGMATTHILQKKGMIPMKAAIGIDVAGALIVLLPTVYFGNRSCVVVHKLQAQIEKREKTRDVLSTLTTADKGCRAFFSKWNALAQDPTNEQLVLIKSFISEETWSEENRYWDREFFQKICVLCNDANFTKEGRGYQLMAAALLAGANPNIVIPMLNTPFSRQGSIYSYARLNPLVIILSNKIVNLNVVRLLLAHKADIDGEVPHGTNETKGTTSPLHAVLTYLPENAPEVVDVLLGATPSPTTQFPAGSGSNRGVACVGGSLSQIENAWKTKYKCQKLPEPVQGMIEKLKKAGVAQNVYSSFSGSSLLG